MERYGSSKCRALRVRVRWYWVWTVGPPPLFACAFHSLTQWNLLLLLSLYYLEPLQGVPTTTVMADALSKCGSNRTAVTAVCLAVSGVDHPFDQHRILYWLSCSPFLPITYFFLFCSAQYLLFLSQNIRIFFIFILVFAE